MTVFVCLLLCQRECLRNYTPDLYHSFVLVTYGRGWVLLWRCRDTLCTYGYMDDITPAHKQRQLSMAAQLK